MQTAIEIIERSAMMHPSLLVESLQDRAKQDWQAAERQESYAIRNSILVSYKAALKAIELVEGDNIGAFAYDMASGIIALNVACRLQCLPPHVRTQAAINQWESN